METAWNRGYIAAAAGALAGALAVGWIGIRVGEAVAGRRISSEEFNLITGLFDLIGAVVIIGVVALLFAAVGTVAGSWLALRALGFRFSGRTALMGLLLTAPAIVIVAPGLLAIAEATDLPSRLVFALLLALPPAIGGLARWISLRASSPNPTV